MGIGVQLVDESGEERESVPDLHDLVDQALAGAEPGSVFAKIDPYGDTTFNTLQVPRFLAEWGEIERLAVSDHERHTWEMVRRLAETVRDTPHYYLKFVGN